EGVVTQLILDVLVLQPAQPFVGTHNGLFVALAFGVRVGPMPENVSKHGVNHSPRESPSTRRGFQCSIAYAARYDVRIGRRRVQFPHHHTTTRCVGVTIRECYDRYDQATLWS